MVRTRHSFESSSATQDALRDDLPREVLSYARSLRAQLRVIARKYGETNPLGLAPKIQSGELHIDDVQRFGELMGLLERVGKERTVPREEVRRLETVAEEQKQAFFDAIGGVVEAWELAPPSASEAEREAALAAACEAMPIIPYQFLIAQETVIQEVITRVKSTISDRSKSFTGLVAMRMMNRSLRAVPAELLPHLRQRIDGEGLNCLGTGWAGGTLVVTGDVGLNLGSHMVGGTIESEDGGRLAGASMKGGTLRITGKNYSIGAGTGMEGGEIHLLSAGDLLGDRMKGGKIFAESAKHGAGHLMTGGEIVFENNGGDRAGEGMSGGTIIARRFGLHVGMRMSGGRLQALSADVGLGKQMSDGEIIVGTAINVGESMTGGTILVGKAKDAGHEMGGGLLIVNEFAETVAVSMQGGSIELRGGVGTVTRIGERDQFGFARRGGTVRFTGKGAWWKNLKLRYNGS
jgi:formylmethanofuran dehydrogenase subunit C